MKIRAFCTKNRLLLGAYALVLSLCISIYVVYDSFRGMTAYLLIPATFLLCATYFALCAFVERHHVIGTVVFCIIAMIVARLFIFFTRYGSHSSQVSFLEWLLTKGSDVEGAFPYLVALFLFFTFFFSVTVYYFSKVLYRMFFLTLLSLIPCVLYVKVMAEINNVSLVLIALCNVAVFMLHRESTKDMGRILKRSTLFVSSAVFMLLLFLLTSAIPKREYAPFYDEFEDLFMGGDTSSEIEDSFSSLSEFSGDAAGFLSLSNRKMYTLTGSVASYLKRQNFDLYDFEKDRWYADSSYSHTYSTPDGWSAIAWYRNLSSLQSALLAAEDYKPGFLAKYNLTKIEDLHLPTSFLQTVHVRSENFGAMYYLVPTNVISVGIDSSQTCQVTPSGAFSAVTSPHPADFEYSYSYYTDYVYDRRWLSAGGADFTNEEALHLLTDLRNVLKEHEDGWYHTADSYLREQIEADYYRELCAANTDEISDRLKELAAEITKDLTYDWEKAEAIEAFFQNGDFTYDLSYHAPDDSPEYFLFESRTGTCSDFASAYVLLARAAGLTVRYAEGYTPENESANLFVIKNRDSHAYPEVFIQNLGWRVYEPTVASAGSSLSPLSFLSNLKMDYGLIGVVLIFLVGFSVLTAALRITVPFLSEGFFRLRLHCTCVPRAALLAYNRLVRKGSRILHENLYSKTPHELAECFSSIGCDLYALCHYTEQVLYASGSAEPMEQSLLCRDYSHASKALRRYRHTGRSGHHKANV